MRTRREVGIRDPIGNDIIFTGGDIGGFACNRGPLQQCTIEINKGPCESGGGVDVVAPCLSGFLSVPFLGSGKCADRKGTKGGR